MSSNYKLYFKNYPNINLDIKYIYGYIPKHNNEYIQTELVFTTSMNGYIEIFTDPSYWNQAIVFTYPSIGNYGMPNKTNYYSNEQLNKLVQNNIVKFNHLPYLENNFESKSIQPSFIIVENFVDLDCKINQWFINERKPIIVINNVKQLVLFLRDNGSQQVCLIKDTIAFNDIKWINFNSINYQDIVSIKSIYSYPGFILDTENNVILDTENNVILDTENNVILDTENNIMDSNNNVILDTENNVILDTENNVILDNKKFKKPVLFIDFGCKYSQIREFIKRGINLVCVPWNYLLYCNLNPSELLNLYSGIFLSSGPGDPRSKYIKPIINKISEILIYIFEKENNKEYSLFPIFGICFGHQIIGQALGYNIKKLLYGHRGIHHPIRFSDIELNNIGFITSQNHGYSLTDINIVNDNYIVKSLFTHCFDNTNQGIYVPMYNIFSVQFHPEACPGPKDTLWLFDYYNLVLNSKIYYSINDYWKKYKKLNTNNLNKNIINDKLDNKKILLLGSGGLQIGQAGEFDYSCSQAIKAFQELGYYVVLINPNVASIQTTLANQTYYLPLTIKYLEQIIKEIKPYAISHSFGGQTALNLCIEAYKHGILKDINIIGTSPDDCIKCEDRKEFIKCLMNNNLYKYTIPSIYLNDDIQISDIHDIIIKDIGYPLLLRNSMALGGDGSCIINSQYELENYFKINKKIVGIELCKSLLEWKEIEVEVMRDCYGNSCVICSMENIDPVGIHTGESIVVAPCQTLNDKILQECRTISIKCAESFNLIGEGNVQLAIHPITNEIKIIEMNPRLSRSSALASKATSYPIAYIAAQIQLGISLLDIPNNNVNNSMIEYKISAFYEPVLDYFAIKMPRWDINKLPNITSTLSTSMKSVGEVLSISRCYNIAFNNVIESSGNFNKEELEFNLDKDTAINYYNIHKYTTHRWIAIINMINNNMHNLIDININKFFLQLQFNKQYETLSYNNIDSFSGEIPTISNYRYLSPLNSNLLYKDKYINNENINHKYKGKIIIIGGSTYRIGSSIEFDWCCVSAARRARKLGYYVIIINDNPETVSTDYQECDVLYMNNPNISNLKNIYKIESELCKYQGIELLGVFISMGGQTSNNLVNCCIEEGINILGTKGNQIINAEDRSKFSSLLDKLQIDQPQWINATNIHEVLSFCDNVGYPTMVRPSFVLSGAGMKIIYNKEDCIEFLKLAKNISGEYPVVVSKFIEDAKEIEVDAISQNGDVRCMAISEHIEDAGVHSGDASIICPAQDLTHETMKRVKAITHQLAIYLEITGPFNLQLLAKNDHLKVIELNLRASRSMPFISRVYKFNFIEFATDIILDSIIIPQKHNFNDDIEMVSVPKYLTSVKSRYIDTIGCKVPQFSFHRFPEMIQDLSVEMKSTGENGCYSKNKYKAYLRAILSSGFKLPNNKSNGKLLLICNQNKKTELEQYLSMLINNDWQLDNYIYISNYSSFSFNNYDLILYIKDKFLTITLEQELILNQLRNVIRNKNQFKFLTKAICYALDNI